MTTNRVLTSAYLVLLSLVAPRLPAEPLDYKVEITHPAEWSYQLVDGPSNYDMSFQGSVTDGLYGRLVQTETFVVGNNQPVDTNCIYAGPSGAWEGKCGVPVPSQSGYANAIVMKVVVTAYIGELSWYETRYFYVYVGPP